MKCGWCLSSVCAVALLCASAPGDEPLRSSEEFARHAMKLREAAISSIEPRGPNLPVMARSNAYAWKMAIRTTVFHVGARGGQKQSAWDAQWAESFGGTDDPNPATRTADFHPQAFIPQQNPFYCALPYNDLARGATKPEAATVIPWFKTAFAASGQSVCKDRWIAIRHRKNGRTAFAQWSDCGPGGGEQVDYVFGRERPKGTRSGEGTGLDVSPAVRDFLGLGGTNLTDWRFVEVRDVLPGPWRTYGENNPFVQAARGGTPGVSIEQPASISPSVPNVVTNSP